VLGGTGSAGVAFPLGDDGVLTKGWETDPVNHALIVILAVLAVLVLAGAGLLVSRRARSGGAAAPIDPPKPGVDYAPGVGDDAEMPRDTPTRLVEQLDLPTGPAVLDVPAPSAGRLGRLRGRLARSQSTLGLGLLAILSRDHLDEQTWLDVEETLLVSDLGVAPTQALVERLRARARTDKASDPAAVRAMLREELLALVGPELDRSLSTERTADGKPAVVLVVGVNGTGKTTTTGKLARVLVADDRDVLLGAADTFRAAAAEQLTTWGDRVGVPTVRGPEGADPASVAYQAVQAGIEAEVDVVLIDTAGRLHTKTGLMDELGKVKRVIEKLAPVSEVLLVLDATTGQNGLQQARVFAEVVDVTGIVLTKLDGTAKGGIVVAVQRELGVPVKLIGLGEGADDLAPFEPEAFVDALLG